MGSNARLPWQTNAPGYTLTSNTNLSLTNWTVVATAPIVHDGTALVFDARAVRFRLCFPSRRTLGRQGPPHGTHLVRSKKW